MAEQCTIEVTITAPVTVDEIRDCGSPGLTHYTWSFESFTSDCLPSAADARAEAQSTLARWLQEAGAQL